VVGPTGIGKSDVAWRLARALEGEIVVADSRQAYRGFEIATNKPSPQQRSQIAYQLIDFVDPSTPFNVFDFVQAARQAVEDITARGRLPIIEGGTMLYLRALLDGFTLSQVPARPERRRQLQALPLDELVGMLTGLDPGAQVDLRNPVRVIRALEVLEVAGPPLARLRRMEPPPWATARVGLWAPAADLHRRLEDRVERQLEAGLVRETECALAAGVPDHAPVLSGIGTAEAVAHLRGKLPASELRGRILSANRRYARRQLAWLRRQPGLRWFPAEPDPVPAILGYLEPWPE
jgi:tRNA dimethylallyltransferase